MKYQSLSRLGVLLCGVLLVGAGCNFFGNKNNTSAGPVGMFVSSDQGVTWKPTVSLPTNQGVKSLAGVTVFRTVDDPTDANSFYWLSRESGLFFTLDGAVSWQQARLPVANAFVYDMAVDPTNKCILYASIGSTVYKSTDCARTWAEVYRQSSSKALVSAISVDPFDSNVVVMTIDDGNILKSIDGGVSWQPLYAFKVPFASVRPDEIQEGIWYGASRKKGLYRSEDGGLSWTLLDKPMKSFTKATDYRRILVAKKNDSTVLYWVSQYGILVSNDSGDTWRPMKLLTPPGSAQIYGFAVNPNNDNEVYYTATINNRSTFNRSSDGGENWTTQKLPSGQIPTMLRVHPGQGKGSIIYVGFNYIPKE